jgi:hypothetical protein
MTENRLYVIYAHVATIPVPAARSDFYGYRETQGRPVHRGGPTFQQTAGILREYAAIVYYRLKGWI